MPFEPRSYLRHVLVEIDYLLDRRTTVTVEAFRSDATLQRAFVRGLEIIGEAFKRTPGEFRALHRRSTGAGWLGCGFA